MPDGEIFTAPVETSTEGKIFFEFPAIAGGREVAGNPPDVPEGPGGGGVGWKRTKGYLKEMLAADRGASVWGEFGIGANAGVTSFTRDILLDEKNGGDDPPGGRPLYPNREGRTTRRFTGT